MQKQFYCPCDAKIDPWFVWTVQDDFHFGPLLSWQYAGTESANAYTTKFVTGEMADVYDVKFARQELTFYVVPPGQGGNARYLFVRNGAPSGEMSDMWARNPLGLF